MTHAEKCKLVQIHGALDRALGDTDPDTYGLTDEEVREEEPVFWAAKEIAGLIGSCPWDKYCPGAVKGSDA